MIGWARERERENCWHLNLTIWYGNLTTWKLNTHYTRIDGSICIHVCLCIFSFRPRNQLVQRPIGRVRTRMFPMFHNKAMMYSLHFRLYHKNYTYKQQHIIQFTCEPFHDSVICNVKKKKKTVQIFHTINLLFS